MGAWGHGPFDDDSALDFIGGLASKPGDATDTLRTTMTAVLDSTEYLDHSDVAAAIVAACLVADRLSPGLITDVNGRGYADRLEFTVSDELRKLAAQVFVRAFEPSDNEWFELWNEGDDMPKVRAEHFPFQAVLDTAAM